EYACLVIAPLSISTPCRTYTSTLCPYTTLFRSRPLGKVARRRTAAASDGQPRPAAVAIARRLRERRGWRLAAPAPLPEPSGDGRSEEHTSELQSRENIVCRLLLEKKKKSKS